MIFLETIIGGNDLMVKKKRQVLRSCPTRLHLSSNFEIETSYI